MARRPQMEGQAPWGRQATSAPRPPKLPQLVHVRTGESVVPATERTIEGEGVDPRRHRLGDRVDGIRLAAPRQEVAVDEGREG